MKESEYYEFVGSLMKPGDSILTNLTPEGIELLHMAVGLAGEAAEVLELVKKHIFYQKPLDTETLTEELGDVEFYAAGIRILQQISHGDVITTNYEKLSKRYSSGTYSDSQAIERKDKDPTPE